MRAVDVAVIGGGVIGAACARAAALRGLAVGIFEPGPDPAAASPASAGMLAAQIEPLDNGLVALAVRSRDQYERLAAELGDTTGIDIRFLVVEGDRGDAAGPEADVDPGRVPELGGKALVLVAD